MDLVSVFWNFCHTLRHEGIDYSDYIEELTYLLFLKIAEERNIATPKGCSWSDLVIHDKESLLQKYNEILTELSKEQSILGDIFRHPIAKIRNSKSLKKLLQLIDDINWSKYNEDVLGSMFEGLLERAANESKKGAGQYFTPRPIIESIVKVMKPNPFESPNFRVSDVACGTAGFIISSFEWWKIKNDTKQLSKAKQNKLFQRTYFGKELVVRPRRMAQMNLYLHGIDPNIRLGDTIYDPYNPKLDGQFTCVLTNPPFGSRGVDQIPERSDFKIKTSNKQLNFVQHIHSCLEDKGRAAIVLPDSVLTEEKAIEIWKHLMPSCRIHTILKLPEGSFLPYANVKANVIFFQKGLPTTEVWIYDARSHVEAVTKRGNPLNLSHFKDFVHSYGDDPNGNSKRKDTGVQGRFRKFTLKDIVNADYRLDITWLKDDSHDSDYTGETAEDLVKEAIDQLKDMLLDLKEVLTIIEK